MRDRLTALGWSEIKVIDEDLGRPAAGGVQRAGFERMVAEVCLGKVGAVCAREVSRFACNSRDLQQSMEMCRVVDTVLVDQETVCNIISKLFAMWPDIRSGPASWPKGQRHKCCDQNHIL